MLHRLEMHMKISWVGGGVKHRGGQRCEKEPLPINSLLGEGF